MKSLSWCLQSSYVIRNSYEHAAECRSRQINFHLSLILHAITHSLSDYLLITEKAKFQCLMLRETSLVEIELSQNGRQVQNVKIVFRTDVQADWLNSTSALLE